MRDVELWQGDCLELMKHRTGGTAMTDSEKLKLIKQIFERCWEFEPNDSVGNGYFYGILTSIGVVVYMEVDDA